MGARFYGICAEDRSPGSCRRRNDISAANGFVGSFCRDEANPRERLPVLDAIYEGPAALYTGVENSYLFKRS